MMRTTLTLDRDVAAELERLKKRSENRSFKDLVNDLLRRALVNVEGPRRKRYKTESHDSGRVMVTDLSNVGELLALADETHR